MKNKAHYQELATQAKDFVTRNYSSQAFGLNVSIIYGQAIESYHSNQMLQMHM